MSKCVGQGMLRGRPFGGTIILIKNDLRQVTHTVHCDEHHVIVKVANYLFVNVYMPCQGTADRITMYDDILRYIWAWCEQHDNCRIFFAGDCNINLDNGCDARSTCINDFSLRHSLTRCDDTFTQTKVATYVNISLNHNSQIDYAASSSPEDIVNLRSLILI